MTGEPITASAVWMAKLAGATAGSAISVAYFLPRGRREAAARFLIGVVTGLVFGAPAGLALAVQFGLGDALSASERIMMGSAAASLCAWWGLGALARFAAGLFPGRGAGADRPGRGGSGNAPDHSDGGER